MKDYSYLINGSHDTALKLINLTKSATIDLTTVNNPIYLKVAAWDNNIEENNSPAEQIIFGYI